jgi:ADP-ribosylglycohydrolase
MKPGDHEARMARARRSLDGLSLGDAYGERFFHGTSIAHADADDPPAVPALPVWRWTDDTAMAISIVEELDDRGAIDPGALARRFAARYLLEPDRGYGGTAHEILGEIAQGRPWRAAASAPHGGAGSMGNGGAMRVAPLGAYFADDLARAASEAARSAEPTHAHPEGAAGAIAIAVAAAAACARPTRDAFFDAVLAHTPAGETRDGIAKARELDARSPRTAGGVLGNGRRVIAPDTVPFALWCAARWMDDYPRALWSAAVALGDMDTNCAIVGGIVALAVDDLPADWLARREPLATR